MEKGPPGLTCYKSKLKGESEKARQGEFYFSTSVCEFSVPLVHRTGKQWPGI